MEFRGVLDMLDLNTISKPKVNAVRKLRAEQDRQNIERKLRDLNEKLSFEKR
jgi:hypothetical protein